MEAITEAHVCLALTSLNCDNCSRGLNVTGCCFGVRLEADPVSSGYATHAAISSNHVRSLKGPDEREKMHFQVCLIMKRPA